MRFILAFTIMFSTFTAVAQNWEIANADGMDHYRRAEYSQATELFSKAVSLSISEHGINSPEHATALTNLAFAYQSQAEYSRAHTGFRTVLRITERLYDSIRIEKTDATINLANSFVPSGDYDSCEFYLMKAQQQIFQAVKERSPHYLKNLHFFFDAFVNVQNGLASLFYKKGQVEKAVALMEQQRMVIRQTYPDVYTTLYTYRGTLNNLANYYLAKEDTSSAIKVIREQIAIAERTASEEPMAYLDAMNNLGSVYRHREQIDSAEYIWNRALATIDKGVGKGTDLHISILSNLGEMQLASDQTNLAVKTLSHAAAFQEKRGGINPRIYQTTLFNLAEAYRWNEQAREADATYLKLSQLIVDEVLHNFTYLSDAEKISFYRSNVSILEDYSLFAFEVSGAMKKEQATQSFTNPNALKDLFDLRLITKGLILHPGYRLKNMIATSASAEIKSKYKQWEESKYSYATLRRADIIDASRLLYLSQQSEALEKWLRSNSPEFVRGFVVEKKSWVDIQRRLGKDQAAVELVRLADGLAYGALILTAETKNGPVAAFTKSTDKLHLEKQFYTQYANAITHGVVDTISYNVYWAPILKVINENKAAGKKIARIYISTDGVYHHLNLNTLFDPVSKRYVLEEVDIRPVTNLKDILVSASQGKQESDAVVVGRPAFVTTLVMGNNIFTDLPGTEVEVNDIQQLLNTKKWTTTLLKHRDAQESAVKSITSPKLLHLATHGFFVNVPSADYVDIMLNSGVALAGAGDGTALNEEDGILTAFEMMNMNLERTNLVVLSACETGLGKFYSGEGVYGLQRALRSAGAKAVIMSLWKVDDVATQQLMTTFYRLWLKDPKDPRGAFRTAQQELKKSFPDPKHWGAFVFTE
jgi:CHAT domain-containing protein